MCSELALGETLLQAHFGDALADVILQLLGVFHAASGDLIVRIMEHSHVTFGGCAVFLGVVMLITACTDKAKPDYDNCVQQDVRGDIQVAWAACNAAVAADPGSASGKAAAARLIVMKPVFDQLKADQATAAQQQAAQFQALRWQTLPPKLSKKIREQAASDLGHGTETPAIDVIIHEAGRPTGTYEGTYGSIHSYVWGVQLGNAPTTEQIKGAPFAARMLRGLTCGDYSEGSVEFYSNGKMISANLPREE